jgi:4-diphosphocytidyl-2-C-methyl-D-erythritol kinase
VTAGGARAARVRAQAKLNLLLRVLARERSGHHQIETLFARVALADDVLVRVGVRGRSLDLDGDELPPEGLGPTERNLAWRAAAAYAAAAGWPTGFAIEVTKRIPAGGGLGGGSADAGAVLRALDALALAPLGESRLLAIAGSLGADVPFLTARAPLALAWGRGERMLELPPLPARPVLLLVPRFAVSTADAYGWVAAARGDASNVSPRAYDLRALSSWPGVAALAANDFEPEVARRHPEIAALTAALANAGAIVARMSGSGSTVFGVLAHEDAVVPSLAGVDARAVLTRTVAHVEEVEVRE